MHLASLSQSQKATLRWHWPFWARPNQLPPPGDWSTWMILAGRGFGKTRSGTEWMRQQVAAGMQRMAIVAETAADARDVLVEGQSGILAVSPKDERPLYEPSKRRLTWPNGAIATLYNGTEPDQLRGPEHDCALVDEIAKYRYAQDTWDNLQFGLRLGERPRVMVTTTPRPIPVIRDLIKDADTAITRGSTYDNASNLPAKFLRTIRKRYEGTRVGRQELYAELLDDVPGALWSAGLFLPIKEIGYTSRVVIGVDPSGASGDSEKSNSIGIVAAASTLNDRFVVLEDASCDLGPAGWGKAAVDLYHKWGADRIVAESNFGGAMVEHVIRTTERNVPVTMVTASRGKALRAEPIAALYEQGRVDHMPGLELLEDQMTHMTLSGYVGDGGSPDRLDAAVWALTDLAFAAESNVGMILSRRNRR